MATGRFGTCGENKRRVELIAKQPSNMGCFVYV